jgi:hypothetical protein
MPQSTRLSGRRLPYPTHKGPTTGSVQSPILFDYLGSASKGHGVAMQEFVARSSHALAQIVERADERISLRPGSGKMMLNIKV